MPNAIASLLRLRHLAMSEAKRSLADCLRGETEAADTVQGLNAAIDSETDAVCRLSDDDRSVEEFGAWLRAMRPKSNAAQSALLEAETRTAEARAVLSSSRAAARAMEELLARRIAERQAAEVRRAQQTLDEIGLSRRGR